MTSRVLIPHVTALASLFLVACGSGVGDASPRVSTIPVQNAVGTGATFTLDLADYVTDPDGDSMTYAVASGGGSFSGSVYSNVFDSMGSWTVAFNVADGEKVTLSSFVVRVKASNWIVTRADSYSLRLLDSDSRKMESLSNSSITETFKAGTGSGWVVYERTQGSNTDLVAYDSFDKVFRTLGNSTTKDEQYVAKTLTDKIVFMTGTTSDRDLFVWNPATNLTKTISAVEDSHDRNAFLANNDRVYYERETASQADIYYYDTINDVNVTVSTNARHEAILGILEDGGVVFSRPGDGGETDIFYYNTGTGVVEVGATTALDLLNKTFSGSGPNAEVVFSAPGATNNDLFFWKPSDGTTTTAGANVTYVGVTTDAKVVFHTTTNAGDISLYAMPAGSAAVVVTTDASAEIVSGLVTKAGVSYIVYERQASPTSLQIYNTTGATTDSITNAGSLEMQAILSNGDLAYRVAAGTAIFHYETTAGTETSVDTGTTCTYAGDTGSGSYGYTKDNATSGTDVHLWNNTGAATVAISTAGGTQAFGSRTHDGDVVYTRQVSPNTTSDLFYYDVSGATSTRLTTEENVDDQGAGNFRDHAVVGKFEAQRTGY